MIHLTISFCYAKRMRDKQIKHFCVLFKRLHLTQNQENKYIKIGKTD
jgi:hypothetical protein